MDKQFVRILMLSVLLPAGAALGEAIQHEHLTFPAADQRVLSRLEAPPPTAAVKPKHQGAVQAVAGHRAKPAHASGDSRGESR